LLRDTTNINDAEVFLGRAGYFRRKTSSENVRWLDAVFDPVSKALVTFVVSIGKNMGHTTYLIHNIAE
jgi:hypothetical protein